MRIAPTNGVWTHTTMNAVQMSGVQMFYFTTDCSGCGKDALLSLELEQGDIRFRCPFCEAEVDHDRVTACDESELNGNGWVTKVTDV